MTSQRPSTRMQETAQTVKSGVSRARRTEKGADRSGCGAAVLEKRQRMERGKEYLVRDGICSSLEETVKATNIKVTDLSLVS